MYAVAIACFAVFGKILFCFGQNCVVYSLFWTCWLIFVKLIIHNDVLTWVAGSRLGYFRLGRCVLATRSPRGFCSCGSVQWGMRAPKELGCFGRVSGWEYRVRTDRSDLALAARGMLHVAQIKLTGWRSFLFMPRSKVGTRHGWP